MTDSLSQNIPCCLMCCIDRVHEVIYDRVHEVVHRQGPYEVLSKNIPCRRDRWSMGKLRSTRWSIDRIHEAVHRQRVHEVFYI